MKYSLTTMAFLALCAAPAANAQTDPAATTGIPLQLATGSELSFNGTSTMHGFTCTTHDLQAFISVDSSYSTADLTTIAHPIISVHVTIPVKSLACGGELEGNMLKTLRAKDYPTITYVLGLYETVPGEKSASAFAIDTKGDLTIAGKTKEIHMRVDASRTADSVVSATGADTLQMTDFGIKPPTFMLGMLRVGNRIIVRYTLKATAKAVARAQAALTSLSTVSSGLTP